MKIDQFAERLRRVTPPEEIKSRLTDSIRIGIVRRRQTLRRRKSVLFTATGLAMIAAFVLTLEKKEPAIPIYASSCEYFETIVQTDDITAIIVVKNEKLNEKIR